VAVVSSLTAVRGSSAPARPGRPRRIVLAAGPGLDGALAELGALADLHPDAHVFDAARANVDDVLTALGRADIAHLACHGRFRVDNPMFSSLELADGPLTVFDLEKLARPPEVVVLAACDVGTAAVGAGDELLGITSALHRAGTRHVIASLVPVPDEAAVGFMVDLHRALLDGRSPAEALAIAREGVVVDEPHGAALRAGFSCFGPL
jgi:CHAT domain-containing protein